MDFEKYCCYETEVPWSLSFVEASFVLIYAAQVLLLPSLACGMLEQAPPSLLNNQERASERVASKWIRAKKLDLRFVWSYYQGIYEYSNCFWTLKSSCQVVLCRASEINRCPSLSMKFETIWQRDRNL